MSDESKKMSIEEWVCRLNEEEMPVFAHTARNIAAVSGHIETPIAELSHLILQDSSMTTRVLRLANSVYYNPGGDNISTVSLAILMLGFDVVRNIALTIAMIDTILKGTQHEHVVEEMARSLHAAVQAKAIAQARGMVEVEEVFIAALLYRLGHLAFWCFPHNLAKALDAEYCVTKTQEKAEQKVLGFTLTHLTMALNKEWQLSKILADALDNAIYHGETIKDIDQAYQLVMAVEQGWGSLDTKTAIHDISKRAKLTLAETLSMVKDNAHLAAQTAIEYGAVKASQLINLPDEVKIDLTNLDISDNDFRPDLSLQLSILRELTIMLSERVDINVILGTVLEGIYRAMGMERTALAFINPQRTELKAKYVYGKDRASFEHCFNFPVDDASRNIFAHIISQQKPFRLNSKNINRYESQLTPDIKKCLGTLDFFAMPLMVNKNVKGLIYADCKFTGRELTEQDFQTFIHFCENANIAFDLLTRR
ncbi:MAG: HDOD domain-containing protein [Gammaproteobacteria bacterium]|nr:HDOD domain-containing protein [Gammaproteobacteria bacterium]